MSEATHKGKIKNVRAVPTGGFIYDRVAPGVTFPSDKLTDKELAELSGPVTIIEGKRKKDE